jgi:hypothetical protein
MSFVVRLDPKIIVLCERSKIFACLVNGWQSIHADLENIR